MKYLIQLIVLLACIVSTNAGSMSTKSPQLVIITSKDNTCECSLGFIRKLYLGRVNKYRDGRIAAPIIYKDTSSMQSKFFDVVLHSSEPRLSKHWSKIEFSGRGSRPRYVQDYDDLVDKIDSDNRYIGFADQTNVDAKKYRVLYVL